MPDWQSHGSPGTWLPKCCQMMPWSVGMHPRGQQPARGMH